MIELPRGWTWSTLAECCVVTLGQSPPGISYNDAGLGTPFFQGKAEFGDLRPTVKKWTTQPTKTAAIGDVLVSVRAPVGPTNLAPCDCAIGRGLGAIRPLGEIDSRYVLYWLRASERELAMRSSGTTFGAISGAVLREHPIPLAPLAEQRRIVSTIEEQFSRLDASEELLARAEVRLRSLRTSTLATALDGGWEMRRLGDLASIISGPAFKSQFFGCDGEGIRLLRGENIEPGALRWRDTKTWPPSMVEGYEHLHVAEADVILAMDRPLISTGLKLARVRESDLPALLVQRVARIRASELVLPAFVYLALRLPRFIPHVLGDQTGTQVPHITLAGIREFPIPLPPLEDQRRIVADVEARWSRIDVLAASVRHARRRLVALRGSVLARAFQGELISQDQNDEPATELLERIAVARARAPKRTLRRVSTVA